MKCVGSGQTEAISWKKTWKMFRSGSKWEFKRGQTPEQSSPWTGPANTEWASRTYVKILTPINMKPPSLSQIKNVCFSPYVLSFLVQRNLFNASMLGHSEVSDSWIAVPLGMISCLAISTAGHLYLKSKCLRHDWQQKASKYSSFFIRDPTWLFLSLII